MRQDRLLLGLQIVVTVLTCAFLIVPAIMSMAAGVTANYFQGLWVSGVTFEWVAQVWVLYADTVLFSIVLAVATMLVTMAVGVPAAYVLARYPSRLGRMFEEIVTLPIAIPGLALALALIITYGGIGDFRQHWTFILVGHVLYTLPFMMRAVMAVLASIDIATLEDGAASLGAPAYRRFIDIVLPNIRGGILAGALMVVTLSIGEFNLTWMLHTPQMKTLPVGLADSYASMRLEVASAYTLVFFLMVIPLLVAMQLAAMWSGAPRSRTK